MSLTLKTCVDGWGDGMVGVQLLDGTALLAERAMNLRTECDYASWRAAQDYLGEHNSWVPHIQAAKSPGVIPNPEAKVRAEAAFMAAVGALFPDFCAA